MWTTLARGDKAVATSKLLKDQGEAFAMLFVFLFFLIQREHVRSFFLIDWKLKIQKRIIVLEEMKWDEIKRGS